MGRSIYLSGSWARRGELQGYAAQLEEDGHFITSRWLQETPHEEEDDGFTLNLGRGKLATIAMANYNDILIADTFLAFTEPVGSPLSRGGRHVEFGFAWAINLLARTPRIRFYVVGPEENLFYADEIIKQFEGFNQLREEFNNGF